MARAIAVGATVAALLVAAVVRVLFVFDAGEPGDGPRGPVASRAAGPDAWPAPGEAPEARRELPKEAFVALPAAFPAGSPPAQETIGWPPTLVPSDSGVLALLSLALAGDAEAIRSARGWMEAFPKPPHGDAKAARAKGEAAARSLQENAIESAITLLNDGIGADPADARLRNDLGHALMAFGNYSAAKTALVESITLDSSRAAAWIELGILFARQGESELAAAAFITSVALSPPDDGAVESLTGIVRSSREGAVTAAVARALDSRAVKGSAKRSPG